jgi:hypothetical protein
LPLLETSIYLVSAVLLFPAFGGGVWLIESTLRQKTPLGRSIRGGIVAKMIAGATWLGGFFLVVGISVSTDSFLFFTFGIFILEGIGLYGAYLWYELQENLTISDLKGLMNREGEDRRN